MFVRIVELYREGMRRPNEEVVAAEPLIGWLETWRSPHTGQLHTTFQGRGFSNGGGRKDLVVAILSPLFNPGPPKIKRGVMTIHGTQITHRAGVMRENAQAWCIRLLEDQSWETKTSDPHYHPECSRMISDDPPAPPRTEPAKSI